MPSPHQKRSCTVPKSKMKGHVNTYECLLHSYDNNNSVGVVTDTTKGKVDIAGIVNRFREERMQMVQTEVCIMV